MTEKRQEPTPGVRLMEVSVKKELTVRYKKTAAYTQCKRLRETWTMHKKTLAFVSRFFLAIYVFEKMQNLWREVTPEKEAQLLLRLVAVQ